MGQLRARFDPIVKERALTAQNSLPKGVVLGHARCRRRLERKAGPAAFRPDQIYEACSVLEALSEMPSSWIDFAGFERLLVRPAVHDDVVLLEEVRIV